MGMLPALGSLLTLLLAIGCGDATAAGGSGGSPASGGAPAGGNPPAGGSSEGGTRRAVLAAQVKAESAKAALQPSRSRARRTPRAK